MVAVTKYVGPDLTRAVIDAGCRSLGESRPQVLWEKAAELAGVDVDWHLIGHLQRNKVKRTLPHTHLVHSADSLRLIESIHQVSLATEMPTRILLEINVSGDSAKHGFPLANRDLLYSALQTICDFPYIQVHGLMAMAGLGSDPETTRAEFSALRELRDLLAEQNWSSNVGFEQLSMGMSGDFESAIEEGATIVRIGSAIFDGVPR